MPEVTADGWYDVSYFAGGTSNYSWHSPIELYITKKSDASYKKIAGQYMNGVNGSSTNRLGSVSNNKGVWKINGEKVYLEACSDYVMNVKLGKGWSLASNKYVLLLSDITLTPTVATPISASKKTTLEYEDYATYFKSINSAASGGNLIREKTAIMVSSATPYVIEMPVKITKEGYYDWETILSTQADKTAVSKITIAVDGETLTTNINKGTDSSIPTWTDECIFDMDKYIICSEYHPMR